MLAFSFLSDLNVELFGESGDVVVCYLLTFFIRFDFLGVQLLDALFPFFFAKRAFSSAISVTMDWANVFHDALQIFDASNIAN
jgi:hypothetical protein